jgi:hypothetical protein
MILTQLFETALKDKADLQAKRKALQDLSANKDVDQKAVQQRKLDLEREAAKKGIQESYDDEDDYEDEDLRLRSGDYVRDQQDGESGEVFRMQGDPSERRVQILDRDGRGWYIAPDRLTRVDPQDPDVQRYFGRQRQRDMDESGMAEGWSDAMVARRTGGARTPYSVYIKGKKWKDFENDDHARVVMDKLKAKFEADGRGPGVITIAPTDMSESVAEVADQTKKVFKDKSGKPVGEIGIDPESSPGNGEWYVHHYATGYSVVGFDSAAEAKRELLYVHKHPDAVDGHLSTKEQGVAEGSESYPEVLYHGSTQEINGPLTPRQAGDIGGAKKSNKNAIYATDDPNFAIAYSLAERGSDTGTFGWKKDPHLIFFGGKIRHGQNVYIHILPTRDEQGRPLFVRGAADAEWYSRPGVKEITPTEVKPLPVDQYLHLLRKPTPEEQKIFQTNKAKANKAKQGVAEDLSKDPELRNKQQFALTHYGNYPKEPGAAFDKWVQRSLMHSEQDDEQNAIKIQQLQTKVSAIEKQMAVYKGQQGVAEAETDYQKRRERERDVDAGKPVARQPRDPQTDYARKRAKEKRDLEQFGESPAKLRAVGLATKRDRFKSLRKESVHESYWTRLQNERNTTAAKLIAELQETIKDIK